MILWLVKKISLCFLSISLMKILFLLILPLIVVVYKHFVNCSIYLLSFSNHYPLSFHFPFLFLLCLWFSFMYYLIFVCCHFTYVLFYHSYSSFDELIFPLPHLTLSYMLLPDFFLFSFLAWMSHFPRAYISSYLSIFSSSLLFQYWCFKVLFKSWEKVMIFLKLLVYIDDQFGNYIQISWLKHLSGFVLPAWS